MNASLTVLLPVYNAQQHLVDRVERLLDLLPDMTPRFEIVIVDDGSTDDTAEIAEQLALFFPQVSVERHPMRLGLDEAIQTGLDASTGEVVIVGDERHGVMADDLRNLWQAHGPRDSTSRRTDAGALGVSWLSRKLGRSLPAPAPAKSVMQIARRNNLNNPPVMQPAIDSQGPALHRRLDAMVAADKASQAKPAARGLLDRVQKYARGE